ncbi:MAG: FAD/NAD(P)-binding protein, partial [Gammaproteobacteria bacterium]|nr:FAD/NAD(P)-binding protein [Gammaproteobacteria bacterium]
MSKHPIIIVGAGLSGLYAAWHLHQQGTAVRVLEARDRIGGRILSDQPYDDKAGRVDLGPAWIWPAFQPLLSQLLNELDVHAFAQHTDGDMLYEVDAHNCQRHGGPSSHQQSYRIAGGAQALVESLHQALPEDTVQLNTKVISIQQ